MRSVVLAAALPLPALDAAGHLQALGYLQALGEGQPLSPIAASPDPAPPKLRQTSEGPIALEPVAAVVAGAWLHAGLAITRSRLVENLLQAVAERGCGC
jgi:hypothetical protein